MGSMCVWWDQATLCSPSAVGICFLSVRTEMGSAVMYQTEIGTYEYMCMCLNAISWHLGHRSTLVRAVCCAAVGNTLGTKKDFGDFFDSEPAVSV